ncbi:hypothetical protein EKO27_g9531 [Xylaria grammica]|uniref:Uncharacterized protein n=1 Tax=Xylaria grammica TaxID=363999 RepID=A0A439CTW1_9PEZI|nr:hypothetical protein EKO27_g9531 [Xylaria grammica]
MLDEDIALTVTLLVTLYTLPVLYLTVEKLSEYFACARARERPSWWLRDGYASFVVGLALALSLFAFYFVCMVPLLARGTYLACADHARTPREDDAAGILPVANPRDPDPFPPVRARREAHSPATAHATPCWKPRRRCVAVVGVIYGHLNVQENRCGRFDVVDFV